MTADHDPVIVAAVRTPIGTAGRALARVDAPSLAAPVLRALVDRSPAPVGAPVEVVLGNCMGPGGNVARVAALAAGLGEQTAALTVDRQCGSGLAAFEVAEALVRARGVAVLAGGVESASTAPWRFWPPEPGADPQRYERAPFAPAELGDPEMGRAADDLAAEHGITREAQDRYAARSHRRAWQSLRDGVFRQETVPVDGVVDDQRPRRGVTAERLHRLPPAFADGGTVTAGNSCGVSDGAAAALVLPGVPGAPGLRIRATASAGVDPRRPGVGLVPAVRLALRRAGRSLDEMDVVELNEAFAGQVLACCALLDLDPERVCPEGGALALGHPWGASGAVLVTRLFSQLVARGAGSLGLAGIAVGGGQGVAMVVEACP